MDQGSAAADGCGYVHRLRDVREIHAFIKAGLGIGVDAVGTLHGMGYGNADERLLPLGEGAGIERAPGIEPVILRVEARAMGGEPFPQRPPVVSVPGFDPLEVLNYKEAELERIFSRIETGSIETMVNGGAVTIDTARGVIRNDTVWKGFFPRGHVLNRISTDFHASFKKRFSKRAGKLIGVTSDSDGLINANGTVGVFAAGNGGPSANTVLAPGAGYNSITVAALAFGSSANPYNSVPNFSSRGPNDFALATSPTTTTTIPGVRAVIDIAAPGQTLTLANLNSSSDPNNYASNNAGTSFAAPLVAGGASLVAHHALAVTYRPHEQITIVH